MGRRTGLIVAKDILVVAVGGSAKTNMVYKCNLNFKLIKTWLSRLIAKGLLDFIEGPPRRWITTDKGLRFIQAMDMVLPMWAGGPPPEGLDMEAIIIA